MKIQVEVKVFEDPEYCLGGYLQCQFLNMTAQYCLLFHLFNSGKKLIECKIACEEARILSMSDEEIIKYYRDIGEDPGKIADHIRKIIQDAIRKYKEKNEKGT